MLFGREVMMMRVRSLSLALVGVSLLALTCSALAQQVNPELYQELRWRLIGPFRAGRTVPAVGIPGQANVFYIGVNNGGVWKSTDYGRTWVPIFDDQPTGSIGALAVAPSDPNIIYVGSGEGLQRPDLSVGDGIYKSTDGGRTWQHLGLRDAQQIASIIVDPKDPNRLFVAVLGHPYGPNAERGVFRSIDGGQSWQKVLYKDENVGAIDLAFDPMNVQTVYAALWAARRPPWTVGNSYNGPGSGLFRSMDGGNTWQPLTRGLPTWAEGLGRIGIGIAPNNPRRMYALVDANPKAGGLFRSDDAGQSWARVSTDERIWGRGSDFAEVKVDPGNPDRVYVANIAMYRSEDGGRTFTSIKGAPGGDDYHRLWINPENPQIILAGVDQGATLTVDGGRTWSSWYNQPTAQFFHVSTDNQFPYWVCGGQQESGSACTLSRSDYGAITFRDWLPVGAFEYAYVVPDPIDSNIIYGGSGPAYHPMVSRFNRVTHQMQQVSPVVVPGEYRLNRTAPLIFSPVDPHTLYFAANVLFKTTTGGNSWEIISSDLTREAPGVPPTLGAFVEQDPAKGKHRGVIYSIGPSFKDVNTIWIGTDDGYIQMTRDGGKTWTNVTPPDLTPWSKVAQIEASHFDNDSAYAAINRLRLDDLKPYIYRTHDGGKTWQKITAGLPDSPVNTVREDPEQKGLLFAGTETGIWVSFDDGAHWQALQLNLPATSMRDLVVHGDDIVVGTHGRSFWILDDITPLRQLAQMRPNDSFLFKPQTAIRIRRSTNTDTPLPPEEPMGQNPPDGAIIDYYLPAAVSGPVVLEVLDSGGRQVRRYSSDDKPEPPNPNALPFPMYWVRMPTTLSTTPGMHRWTWDLHYPRPDLLHFEYPISAIPHQTPLEPLGPRALPGEYTVRLTVGGRTYTQPLTVKMDPRVATSAEELRQQHEMEMNIASLLQKDFAALAEVRKLRPAQAAELEKGFVESNEALAAIYDAVDSADVAPTTQAVAALAAVQKALEERLAKWGQVKGSTGRK